MLNELIMEIKDRQNALDRKQYELDYMTKSRMLEMEKRGLALVNQCKDLHHSMQLGLQNVYAYGDQFQQKMEGMLESGYHQMERMISDYDSHLKDFAYGFKDQMYSIRDEARGYADMAKGFADQSKQYRDETMQYGEGFKKDLKHFYDDWVKESDNRLHMMDNKIDQMNREGEKWYSKTKHEIQLENERRKTFRSNVQNDYNGYKEDMEGRHKKHISELEKKVNSLDEGKVSQLLEGLKRDRELAKLETQRKLDLKNQDIENLKVRHKAEVNELKRDGAVAERLAREREKQEELKRNYEKKLQDRQDYYNDSIRKEQWQREKERRSREFEQKTKHMGHQEYINFKKRNGGYYFPD